MAELTELKMAANFVNLSACETGIGIFPKDNPAMLKETVSRYNTITDTQT